MHVGFSKLIQKHFHRDNSKKQTWHSGSTNIFEKCFVAIKVRCTFPCEGSSLPMFSDHTHQEGQEEQCAWCWIPHLQSWWFGLQVWQCDTQCTLRQSSCKANNNTEPNNMTAMIIWTAGSPLDDKESNVIAAPHNYHVITGLFITWYHCYGLSSAKIP